MDGMDTMNTFYVGSTTDSLLDLIKIQYDIKYLVGNKIKISLKNFYIHIPNTNINEAVSYQLLKADPSYPLFQITIKNESQGITNIGYIRIKDIMSSYKVITYSQYTDQWVRMTDLEEKLDTELIFKNIYPKDKFTVQLSLCNYQEAIFELGIREKQKEFRYFYLDYVSPMNTENRPNIFYFNAEERFPDKNISIIYPNAISFEIDTQMNRVKDDIYFNNSFAGDSNKVKIGFHFNSIKVHPIQSINFPAHKKVGGTDNRIPFKYNIYAQNIYTNKVEEKKEIDYYVSSEEKEYIITDDMDKNNFYIDLDVDNKSIIGNFTDAVENRCPVSGFYDKLLINNNEDFSTPIFSIYREGLPDNPIKISALTAPYEEIATESYFLATMSNANQTVTHFGEAGKWYNDTYYIYKQNIIKISDLEKDTEIFFCKNIPTGNMSSNEYRNNFYYHEKIISDKKFSKIYHIDTLENNIVGSTVTKDEINYVIINKSTVNKNDVSTLFIRYISDPIYVNNICTINSNLVPTYDTIKYRLPNYLCPTSTNNNHHIQIQELTYHIPIYQGQGGAKYETNSCKIYMEICSPTLSTEPIVRYELFNLNKEIRTEQEFKIYGLTETIILNDRDKLSPLKDFRGEELQLRLCIESDYAKYDEDIDGIIYYEYKDLNQRLYVNTLPTIVSADVEVAGTILNLNVSVQQKNQNALVTTSYIGGTEQLDPAENNIIKNNTISLVWHLNLPPSTTSYIISTKNEYEEQPQKITVAYTKDIRNTIYIKIQSDQQQQWRTGKVYIKTDNNTWTLADNVYIKTENGWTLIDKLD